MASFCKYGDSCSRGIPLLELLAQARTHKDLIARVEDSGCEGIYVEVARYSEKRQRWEKYCFEKFFGGEHSTEKDLAHVTAYETALKYAQEINDAADDTRHPLIHTMPSWEN